MILRGQSSEAAFYNITVFHSRVLQQQYFRELKLQKFLLISQLISVVSTAVLDNNSVTFLEACKHSITF